VSYLPYQALNLIAPQNEKNNLVLMNEFTEAICLDINLLVVYGRIALMKALLIANLQK